MRFRPNIHASTDHEPGPIIASVKPDSANANGMADCPCERNAMRASASATTIPTTGVHKPAISSAPASAPTARVRDAAHMGSALKHAYPP